MPAADRQLVEQLGFDAPLMAQLRAHGSSFTRFETFARPDFHPIPGPGLVLDTPAKQGESVLRELRKLLANTRYQAWLYDNKFGYGPDQIVVLATRDPYAYLALIPINGTNYGIDHDAIIEKYREWDRRLALELTGAGGDWLSADIAREPGDWLSFAREVYAFCPDIVDQGTNDVETLATEMRSRKQLFLWWD